MKKRQLKGSSDVHVSNDIYKCSICGKTFRGFGNNPEPFVHHGRCCDNCNRKYVVPFRFMLDYQAELNGKNAILSV